MIFMKKITVPVLFLKILCDICDSVRCLFKMKNRNCLFRRAGDSGLFFVCQEERGVN